MKTTRAVKPATLDLQQALVIGVDGLPQLSAVDEEVLASTLDDAVAKFPTLGLDAELVNGGVWTPRGGETGLYRSRVFTRDRGSQGSFIRVTSTMPAAQFTPADAEAALGYLHMQTHFQQVMESVFPQVEQAKVLLRGPVPPPLPGVPVVGPRRRPESSVARMSWVERKQRPRHFLIGQRTGRMKTQSGQADVMYHVMTSLADPGRLSAPLDMQGGPVNGPLDCLPLLVVVVGIGRVQGSIEVTMVAEGLKDCDPRAFLGAGASMCSYIAGTVAAHRCLGLPLADGPHPELCFITPLLSTFKTLVKLPTAMVRSPSTESKSSQSASSSEGCHLVCIRFLCSTGGTFLTSGQECQDGGTVIGQCKRPAPVRFRPGQATEVRLLVSQGAREVPLTWTGLGKGKGLHRYMVEVKPLRASAVSRYAHLLDGLSMVEAHHPPPPPSPPPSQPLIPSPTASIIRHPLHLSESPLLYVLLTTTNTADMHASTSVRALRRMTKPPPLSITFIDALWPFVAAMLPHALLWYALYEHPELAEAFESLSYVLLAIGLFIVQLVSSVTLHAFATAKVRPMLNLGRLEFAILDATTWRALAMGVHFMYNAAAVAIVALAAKLMAAEGHHAPTITLLMHMDMGADSSAKAFLLFLTALLSLLHASALALVHILSDSNREFCLDLITWRDAIGVIKPLQAPPPVPVGAPPGFPKKSSSSGITSPTSRARVASASAPFCDVIPCSGTTCVPSTTQSSQRSRTQSPSRADGLPYKSMPPDMTASPPRPTSPNRRSSAATARGGAASPTYHDAPAATSSSRHANGGGSANGGATGSAYGRTVEPDYAKHTAGRTVDRAMTKSGPVQEERFTGALHRHKVWKEVWLTVDDTHVTVQKRKDDHSVVHHSFPLAEVSTSRLPGPEFGFRVTCRGSSIDLRCDSETTVDKWLSVIQWNQLVLSRLRRSRSLPT